MFKLSQEFEIAIFSFLTFCFCNNVLISFKDFTLQHWKWLVSTEWIWINYRIRYCEYYLSVIKLKNMQRWNFEIARKQEAFWDNFCGTNEIKTNQMSNKTDLDGESHKMAPELGLQKQILVSENIKLQEIGK